MVKEERDFLFMKVFRQHKKDFYRVTAEKNKNIESRFAYQKPSRSS